MVFALVGDYKPSSRTKLQLDRTAKILGGCNFIFLPQRPILDTNTKKN